jgi:hypothetical protein
MKFRLKLEQWGPALVAAALAAVWWKANLTIPGSYSKELLGALLSAASICAGFLTTALSILLPIGATETGRRMHLSGNMQSVHRYLRSAILGSLALAAICVMLFFLLPSDGSEITNGYSTVLVGGTTYAAFALARIAEILLNLFERMSAPEDLDG